MLGPGGAATPGGATAGAGSCKVSVFEALGGALTLRSAAEAMGGGEVAEECCDGFARCDWPIGPAAGPPGWRAGAMGPSYFVA